MELRSVAVVVEHHVCTPVAVDVPIKDVGVGVPTPVITRQRGIRIVQVAKRAICLAQRSTCTKGGRTPGRIRGTTIHRIKDHIQNAVAVEVHLSALAQRLHAIAGVGLDAGTEGAVGIEEGRPQRPVGALEHQF